MEINEAKSIIAALADGVNPLTGELISNDSIYQNPQIIRALFMSLDGLKRMEKSEMQRKELPINAGKPWNDEEEQNLINEFKTGMKIKELSEIHGRSDGAIRTRLLILGLIIN